MFVLDNVPLHAYSTMKLGGVAAHLVDITNRFYVEKAVSWAKERDLPFIVIGQGSNVIWRDEGFNGLVIVNKIQHFDIYDEDPENVYLTVGAGEQWDSVVERVVAKNLSGIETLSLIPGTVGATPVQNVGAYGTEVSDCITTLEAYDTTIDKLVTLRGSECAFAYRTSRFKTTDKRRFIITAVTFRLQRTAPKPPFYASLQTYLSQNNITDYTAQAIRDAVIAIRSSKLPDPLVHPNNGSFFQNPIIETRQLNELIDYYPDISYWDVDKTHAKISAAWLLEASGFKDFHDQQTGMSTWKDQSLVFVNESAKKTQDLIDFKAKIVQAVREKFGITLNQEPELLP